METSIEFILNDKALKFVNELDMSDNSKIFTNRYFYMNIRGQKQPMIAKQNKIEYYNDLQLQIKYLQGKTLTEKDFFEALVEGCKNHILKYGRLIITDLWTQLNSTMHIIDATKGVFHNHILTEEDGIELRNYYLNAAKEVLIDFILVPDPNDIGGIGRSPKLVPLKSINN